MRVQSFSDHLVLFAGSVLIAALGVLIFVFPARLLPTDPAAYEVVSGTLDKVADRSGRKMTRVVFRLRDHQRVFESRSIAFHGGADGWVAGTTSLRFHIARNDAASGADSDPVRVYGLAADGRGTRSLAEDIARANATASVWSGILTLFFGVVGMAVAVLAWRRRRA